MALKDFHKTGNSCFKEEIIHFISLFLIVCLMCVWCKTNTTIFTLHLITATRTIKKNNLEQIESYQFSPLSQPNLAVIDTILL